MGKIKDILKERVLVLDGPMGTMVQGYGLNETDFRGSQFKDHSMDLMGNNDILSILFEDINLDGSILANINGINKSIYSARILDDI